VAVAAQGQFGVEAAPRSRGSLAVRCPSRTRKVADSIPAARFCYAPRLEGPGLAVGALAAQGELGLEAAPRSRGNLAARGPSRTRKVADSIPAARFCYAPRLEGPGLAVGVLAAQGELGLEAAPRSRGNLAARVRLATARSQVRSLLAKGEEEGVAGRTGGRSQLGGGKEVRAANTEGIGDARLAAEV
jgi:hypothetical protein